MSELNKKPGLSEIIANAESRIIKIHVPTTQKIDDAEANKVRVKNNEPLERT